MDRESASACLDRPDPYWQIEHMTVAGIPEGARVLRQRIMAFLSASPLSLDELSSIELAVGEACTNALKHGSPGHERDEIRAKCMRNHETLIVEITDNGSGFDPQLVVPPKPEELRESGMGIMLMRRLMDSVEFEFGRGTTVRLVKHYRAGLTDL